MEIKRRLLIHAVWITTVLRNVLTQNRSPLMLGARGTNSYKQLS